MQRKMFSFGAMALGAIATVTIPNVDSDAALAEAAGDQFTLNAPAQPLELVPETPEFIAEEVVQPLPAETPTVVPAPVLTEAGSLAGLVGMVNTATPLSSELHCLAGAVYFEARGEPPAGQLAVAQVIINRSEDRRFPRTYCGVVAQPGQFSFMRGKQMPQVRDRSAAWTRAVAIAQIAHQGLWESEAGDALFFHAKYVRPSWSQRKTRLAQINTHIFYR
jgi:hypothetical protein